MRASQRGRKLLILVFSSFLGLLIGELGLRIYYDYVVPPKYQILHLQPDPEVGWKHVENLKYTWTGGTGTAYPLQDVEFRVPVEINEEGFRDRPHQVDKAAETTRVVLLGDSFLAALQVPWEKTAAQVLERELETSGTPREWEVFNFGVPGFSVGQYLQTYEHYARKYSPDFVVVLLSPLQMVRTHRPYTQYTVRVRPTYTLDQGDLQFAPADFEGFQEEWLQSRERKFLGTHRRRLFRNTLALDDADDWWSRIAARSYLRQEIGPRRQPEPPASREHVDMEQLLALNFRVLDELHRRSAEDGASLAVIDLTLIVYPNMFKVSRRIQQYCADRGFAYVNLRPRLEQLEQQGISTRWPRDGHFTEDANAALASAMKQAIRDSPANGPGIDTPASASH